MLKGSGSEVSVHNMARLGETYATTELSYIPPNKYIITVHLHRPNKTTTTTTTVHPTPTEPLSKTPPPPQEKYTYTTVDSITLWLAHKTITLPDDGGDRSILQTVWH